MSPAIYGETYYANIGTYTKFSNVIDEPYLSFLGLLNSLRFSTIMIVHNNTLIRRIFKCLN